MSHKQPAPELKALFADKAFTFGAAISAFQTEGAATEGGRVPSIWDEFLRSRFRKQHAAWTENSRFYENYAEVLRQMREHGFRAFRFSISWSRVGGWPGTGINKAGLDFYNRLIDTCLGLDIEPWITCYHWDLPAPLQQTGGWTQRDTPFRFADYCEQLAHAFGDRVGHWMVLNEPLLFTAAGHLIGVHAPGLRGRKNFLPAMVHAQMALHLGYAALKSRMPGTQVGSTFSQTPVEPFSAAHEPAANRVRTMLNDLFLPVACGQPWPVAHLPWLAEAERWLSPGDDRLLHTPLDFIGLQTYTRFVVKQAWYMPWLQARPVSARVRKVPGNSLGWEVYPQGITDVVHRAKRCTQLPLVITESGLCLRDEVRNGYVQDQQRIDYYRKVLAEVCALREEGADIRGFFCWSLLDNLEWTYGLDHRFGLFYTDYAGNAIFPKSSARWFRHHFAQANARLSNQSETDVHIAPNSLWGD